MVEYAPSNEPEAGKRRSTRIVQAIPITVTGVDALGQPFRERTSTLTMNCHGFKYQSKHYVLKGTWLEVEALHPEAGKPARKVHGQVNFVQRPRSAKELFQVGVEMDTPGNVWGVAFPPDDWIPFPELTAKDLLHPPAKATAGADAPPAVTNGTALYSVPPAIAADLSVSMNRQVARMLSDAQEQIQRMAREASAGAVSRESVSLLRDLNIQLRTAAEKAVEQVSTAYAEQAVRKAMKKIEEARETSAQELRATWAREFEKDLRNSSQGVLAKLTEAGETFRKEFSQQIAADVAAASGRLEEIESRVKEMHEQNQAASDAAQTGWRQKLEQDLAEASARLEKVHSAAIASAQQQLAEHLEEAAAGAASNAAAEMDKRAGEIRALVTGATAEAERRVAAGQASLDEQLLKGRACAGQIEVAARRIQDESRQLEEKAKKAAAEMARQFKEMLAGNREQLDQQTGSVLASLSQRLEPALKERGAEMVARVAAEVEKQVGPRLQRAEGTIKKLKELEAVAAQTLRQEQARLQSEFEKASQTALTRCLEELDAKSTDATHETIEQLYKSAEWYQRKAQTSMQTAFERGLTQATTNLREKAAEISTMFASELDYYSRSYSEHTQGLLEEAAKEMATRIRAQMAEATETGAAQFSDEIHRLAEDKVERLQASSDSVVEQAQGRLMSQVENGCRQIDARAAQSSAEFQQHLAERMQQGANEAKQEFQRQLVPVLEGWRAEQRAHQELWLQTLDQKSNESVEQFKHRLENVANSWMVTAVTTLSQHSQGVIDSMAKAVDQRLRDICAEVFTGAGENMRQRLLDIATELKKGGGE